MSLALLLGGLLVIGLVPPPPASAAVAGSQPAAPAQQVMTYRVAGAGNSTDLGAFAGRVAEILDNPRGWSLGGSLQFVPVPSGGDFVLWLAAPERLPGFSPGCSALWSCRVGANVIINETRWTGGTDAWNATGASIADYQAMVLNHEVGHRLGLGHASCGAVGAPAPVMQQQSKGMQGCAPNPWPTEQERASVAARHGVGSRPLHPACRTGPVAGPATAESAAGAAAVLLDTESGSGTDDGAPCRIKPGATAGVYVGPAEGRRDAVQLIRVDRVTLDSPGRVRLWTSAGSSALVTPGSPPAEFALRVGADGMIFAAVDSQFGWAGLAVSDLGREDPALERAMAWLALLQGSAGWGSADQHPLLDQDGARPIAQRGSQQLRVAH